MVTTVDDFNDGDLSEYTILNGTSNDVHTVTSPTYEGSHAIALGADDTDNPQLQSTSGLNAYPQPGQTFEVRMQKTDGANDDDSFRFGVQDETVDDDYYEVRMWQRNDDYFALYKKENGTLTQLDAYDPFAMADFPDNEWARLEIVWGDSGGIDVTLYHEDGTQWESSLSATDTTFTSGGIGFWHGVDASNTHWDLVQITAGDTTQVELVTTSQDADQASAPLNRTRTLGATTQDADRAAATLQRARTLSLHIQDADQGAAALGLAWSLAVTSQDAEQAAAALQRSRALASTSQDADQASGAVNRFRALSTTGQDADQSLVALDLAGIVALALSSQDADQASTALQRARTLALTAQDADASAVAVNRARTLSSLSQDADQVDFALDFGFRVTDAVSLNGEFNPTIRLTGEFNPQERLKGDWIVVRLTGVFDPDEGMTGNLDTPWSDEQ